MSIGSQEAEIIAQARRGDQEAIEKLLAAYEKQVLGFIRARVYNDSDATDLAQET